MRTRFFLSVLFFFFCLNALSYAQIAAVGDLNGDGKPDVVVGNVSSNTVTIFINDGTGTPHGNALSCREPPGLSSRIG
jgi:hypothetical protein